jgi:hypothetical protein
MQRAMKELLLVDAAVGSDEVEEFEESPTQRASKSGSWRMKKDEEKESGKKEKKKISYAVLAERTDASQLARVFERLYSDAVERLERVKNLVEDSDTGKQMKLEKIFCVFRAVTTLASSLPDGVSPTDFRAFFSHYVDSVQHKPITNFWLANNFFARRKRLPKREPAPPTQLPNITVNNFFISHLPNRHS